MICHLIIQIEEYIKKDSRIRLIKMVDLQLLEIEAKGKYLAFIDSDDLWNNNFLQKSIDFIEKYDYIFIFSSYRIVEENLVKIILFPQKLIIVIY